ncbi:MAG: bifunctional adenosylcobinamide kinase/adenosylcobinamide-phosphate guanylyltransferase [Desulfobacterales bacterium]|nr:MAG: bifunctional adenosylcobinamide kinase/adenosylcobinamide-phosphate guanylyltransferase [Desulfobacterales bacterium]
MREVILVIGGCRSGKSRYALNLAAQVPGQNKIFVATCIPGDDEMKQRVDQHKKEREPYWKTIEVPVLLPEAIIENSRKGNVLVIDCLTLWVNNLFMENDDQEHIEKQVKKLTRSFEQAQCPVILVSNEVGTGIVPENKLARRFRDVMGYSNQNIAASADKVIWIVAGIPVTIKGIK